MVMITRLLIVCPPLPSLPSHPFSLLSGEHRAGAHSIVFTGTFFSNSIPYRWHVSQVGSKLTSMREYQRLLSAGILVGRCLLPLYTNGRWRREMLRNTLLVSLGAPSWPHTSQRWKKSIEYVYHDQSKKFCGEREDPGDRNKSLVCLKKVSRDAQEKNLEWNLLILIDQHITLALLLRASGLWKMEIRCFYYSN